MITRGNAKPRSGDARRSSYKLKERMRYVEAMNQNLKYERVVRDQKHHIITVEDENERLINTLGDKVEESNDLRYKLTEYKLSLFLSWVFIFILSAVLIIRVYI